MTPQRHLDEVRAPALSMPGLLFFGPRRELLACNAEAARILCYPEKPDKTRQLSAIAEDKLPLDLLRAGPDGRDGTNFLSGRRRYVCSVHVLDIPGRNKGSIAVVLERVSSAEVTLYGICKKYNLTSRERQAMGHLLRGLTSKEIAQQMSISPNTVKAFVRSAMTKMGVSTRAGLVGRIAESSPGEVQPSRGIARARGA
jgi:DNA-binding CsgD family transcriptional regulator